jgi:hypothetical protein
MNINQVPEVIDICYKAKRVPFFWGMAGIGKSEAVADSVRRLGEKLNHKFELVDLRLGCMEVGDLIGLPRDREVSPGIWATIWTRPQWFPYDKLKCPICGHIKMATSEPHRDGETCDYKGCKGKMKWEASYGIVFLDEFNRAGTTDVLQAMFQFVLGNKEIIDGKVVIRRHLHTHLLPDGWSVVCAGNPDTADYNVQGLDAAMLDRLIHVVIDLESSLVLKWQKENLSCGQIYEFCKTMPTVLGKNINIKLPISPSPRSWDIIDTLIQNMTPDQIRAHGTELFTGIVGSQNAINFMKYLNDSLLKPLNAEDVLNAKSTKEIEKMLEKFINPDKQHLELLDLTTEKIVELLSGETFKLTKSQADNFVEYLTYLPHDMALQAFINFIKDCKIEDNCMAIVVALQNMPSNEFIMNLLVAAGAKREEIIPAVEKIREIQANAKTSMKEKE